MSRIRENNISNMFAASLSFNGEEKVAEYSLAKEDMIVEKYAGIDIYQPTVENVEDFIRKYTMNETAFFPKALEIHTFLNPSAFDSANQDYVSEATGVVKIRLHDANLEFPFYVTDGELVPFDIIQLNGQRIPYSRENLRRVLFGIDKTFADKVNGAKGSVSGEFSPYVRVEKSVNPATSSGFLGNVLQIQDQTMRGNGSNFITASAKLDSGMEKLSSMKQLTMQEVSALENEFKKQAQNEFKGELEKFAKEIEEYDDKSAVKLFTNLDNLQFENAGSLPNGTSISFPEKKDKEMCMTKGLVIDNYMSIAGKKAKANKIVVAEDGRMIILESGDKFLCFKANEKFSLPSKSLSSATEGDIILAFNGDSALVPSVVEGVTERGLTDSKVTGDIKFKVLSMGAVNSISTLLQLMKDSSSIGMSHGMSFGSNQTELKYYKIAPMQDVKFNEIQYKEYIKKLAEKTGISELSLAPILREYSVANETSKGNIVFCTDFDTTKVIKVSGIISDYLKDKADLRKLVETNGEFNMPKTAGEGEKIYIKCIDPSRGVYYVQIKYIDKSKTVFNQMTKEYRDVPEAGVKQILRVLGFDGGQSAEMMHKASEMGSVNMPLPSTARVDMLTGANVINRSTQQVKNVMGKLVSPQAVGDAVLTSALGALMTGAITSRGLIGQPGVKDKAREALSLASKFASESEALSVAFEKCAQEHQSTSMLKVAKVMAESALLHNKTIEVMNGNCYPRLIEAAYDITCGKKELEKIASELIDLKFTQYKNKDHIINPNYIQGAVRQLDNMYKLAYELVQKDEKFAEKLATEASEIPGTPEWEKDEEKKECPKCHHNPCTCGGNPLKKEQVEKKAESVAEELGIVKDKKDNEYVCQSCGKARDEAKEPHCSCGHDHTVRKEDFVKKASDEEILNSLDPIRRDIYTRNPELFAMAKEAAEKGIPFDIDIVDGYHADNFIKKAETDTDVHTQQADDNDTAVGLEPNNTETMAIEDELKRKQEADIMEDKENEALKSDIDSDTHYVMANEYEAELEKIAVGMLNSIGEGWKAVGKGLEQGTKDGAKLGETMKNTWNGMNKAQKAGVAGTTGAGLVAANRASSNMTKEQKDGAMIAGSMAPLMAMASEDNGNLDKEAKYFKHEDFTPEEETEFNSLNDKYLDHKLYKSSDIKRFKELGKKLNGVERIRLSNNSIKNFGGYAGIMSSHASEEINELYMQKQAGIADTLKTVGKVSGATYGAIGGAALGAGAGALGAQQGHRAEGALKGGALGAVAGGVGGAVGGKAIAQKGQELYTTGAKHGFMGGAVAGAGLGAAATHVAENGGVEAVKDMAGKAKGAVENVANKAKETAQNVASKVKGEGKTVAENTAEQNGAQKWEQTQKELQSQPAPQPNVQPQAQPQPQAVPQQQVVQGQSVAQQQILDANGQPLMQGQPQQVPMQQPNVQGQINPNQPPAPRPEPSQMTSTSPANTVDTNGQPGQQLDANGQPMQQAVGADGKQHWFSGVANWWNNLGKIPTNQVGNEVQGLNYPGLNTNQPIFKDVPQQINSTASELLNAMFMEKMAAMNVPSEEEKAKESNGENLAEITCEVCGYKGQPDEYGKCPTCGAQGGITPVDPASKVEQPNDEYDMDRHMIDQDQIAQGEMEIMDYI